MTSSRANPNASIDIFSDYDIELMVTGLNAFSKNEEWICHFGKVIANIKEINRKSLTQLVLYSDGIRIDFQVYTVTEFNKTILKSFLPTHWDIGYKFLLDKDEIACKLPLPTNTLYNTSRPTETEFIALVKDFWWDVTYVAKSLWRDEIFYAKYMAECLIHNNYLKKMIEWHIGSTSSWLVNINKDGRWFKRYLDEETWNQVERIYSDNDIEHNWHALFVTTSLFSKVATELAVQLNYEYPILMEKDILEYLKKIQRLEKNATNF